MDNISANHCYTPKNHSKKINICDAPWPKALRYDSDQKELFGTPAEQENLFATEYLKKPKRNRSLNGYVFKDAEISEAYTQHFLNWLKLIHNESFKYIFDEDKDYFYEVCDVALVRIFPKKKSIILARVEFRPCAQGLGLIKLLLCQLIKTCQIQKKSLVVYKPFNDNRCILESLFGKNDLETLKSFIFENKEDKESFLRYYTKYQTFDELSLEDQLELNKKTEKLIYLIEFEKLRHWSDVDILRYCRVAAMVAPPYYSDGVVVINQSYLPPASEMNDQEKVDERYNISQAKRIMEDLLKIIERSL